MSFESYIGHNPSLPVPVEIIIMFEVDEMNVNEGDGLVELCLKSNEPFPEDTILPVFFSGCSGDQCGEQYQTATGGGGVGRVGREVGRVGRGKECDFKHVAG